MTRLGLAMFLAMNVMMFTLVLWSEDVYDIFEERAAVLHELIRWLCMVLALPVLLLLGGPLLENALAALRERRMTTDLLLVLGVAAAYLYSVLSVVRGDGHIYFEVGAMVLVAVTLGRWLEATAKLKTTESLAALERLLPDTVRVVEQIDSVPGGGIAQASSEGGLRDRPTRGRLKTGTTGFRARRFREKRRDPTGSEARRTRAGRWETGPTRDVKLGDVRVGDVVRVLAGERIPIDGLIVHGRATIDPQLVTGESQPAVRDVGERVLAGSLNLDGDLAIEVTATAGDGTLKKLVDTVRAAAAAKGRSQRLADRVAAWFTPTVTVIALAALTGHWWLAGFQHGLLAGLAVLLIACPCTLGVATPLATWSALGAASRAGVLFRDTDAVARLSAVRAVCFDKTGTLTDGDVVVYDLAVDSDTPRDQLVRRAASLASSSAHGLSLAICRFLGNEHSDRSLPYAIAVQSLPGRGIVGRIASHEGPTYLGSLRLMDESRLPCGNVLGRHITEAREAGHPIACIGWNGKTRGVFVFGEQLRTKAESAVHRLRDRGIHVAVLTGDGSAGGAALERRLGVHVEAELLPQDKQAAIANVRQQYGPVAMVGDGVNDAPALAAADIGIAMGCGADVSRDAADVCLLGSDLSRLPWAIDVAHRTVRTVRQNLFWTFAYNSIGIVLAAAGLLNPIIAALAMIASSAFVVSNSLRLSRLDLST
jgi:heavy metal translocating P-type ATPase